MLFPALLIALVRVRARRYVAGLGFLGLAFAAQASVVITGTRIIYPAPAREVSVQIKNVGAVPALVQVWLDRGDDSAQPGSAAAQTPFLLTPPIARLEPKRGQTIRLVYSGEEILPADRESLFYFNLLDIPPKPTDDAQQVAERNMLQLAVRSRLKLFYRPEALKKLSSDAAWKKLVWRAVADKDGAVALELENPSPFHVNVQRVDALSQGAVLPTAEALAQTLMLAPFARERVDVPTGARAQLRNASVLRLQIINDYGGVSLIDVPQAAAAVQTQP